MPEEATQEVVNQEEGKDRFGFDNLKLKLNNLIQTWGTDIEKETERYRLLRYIKADKETLQTIGLFKEDETYTPVRLIDQNIRAEQPQFLSYITQSRRAVIFKPFGGLEVPNVVELETVFTDCARYLGWEKSFIRVVDGAATHGWDAVEVTFDIDKSGHFAVEHVGHENLIFDLETEELNAQEVILRIVKFTAMQLRDNIKDFNFAKEQVDKVLSTGEGDKNQRDQQYRVYKCFYKKDKIVYVGWYGGEKTTDWLLAPAPLFLGRRDITGGLKPTNEIDPATNLPIQEFAALQESEYPFYILPYIESEDPRITEIRGRAFQDEPAQEAASAILSGIVNGTMRAANVYGAPAPAGNLQTDVAAPKQTDIKLVSGVIYDRPMVFFNTDYPPPSAIQSLQVVTTTNKSETAKVDFAAQNRKDSRKTATEIQAAEKEASQLGSVQVTQLSIFMRQVYGRCYAIFSNRVLQGKIEVTETIKKLCGIRYEIKSSGDIDVIERQEKIQRQQQAWPVISKTPLAMEFLKDIIRSSFPDDAERYIGIIDQQDIAKQIIPGMAEMIQTLVTDETGKLKPEYQQYAPQLMKLKEQVMAFMMPQNPDEPKPTEGGEQSNP